MVRLVDLPERFAASLRDAPCPSFEDRPFVKGPPLARRRVAILSTAGLQRRGDRPFADGDATYRLVPGDCVMGDLVMSHISTNFDRSAFEQDYNAIFPLDRLREMAADGEIGSVAGYHYSFMGAADPARMEPAAAEVARHLKADGVDAVVLLPV